MSEESSVNVELQRQLKILKDGVLEITPEQEFIEMLRESIVKNIPLRIKCGIDPTSTDVHIGHLVPYKKMRQFQDLGHTGIVVIGDYTAQIGDPTGRNEARPALTLEQTRKNAEKYMDQVYTVLDKDKTEVVFQTQWFEQVSLKDILKWASWTTVAKLLAHDTFKNRLEQNDSLCLHEIFYPILQGIDSVEIRSDVELGGSDQKFNVLMGRDYQKAQGQRPQVAMLLPIITGLCGTQKMSKSLNNYISIMDEPFDKFGKIMSIPDELMAEYFRYVVGASAEEVENIQNELKSNKLHPNEVKKDLASKVVAFFHSEKIAQEMRQKFQDVFAQGKIPQDAPTYIIQGEQTLMHVLSSCGMFSSNSEIRRLIKQSAVSLIDVKGDSDRPVKMTDENFLIDSSLTGFALKIGKRKFLKLA